MRVIFMGTPDFAIPSLDALVTGRYDVCAIFTQPDRPAGRGQKAQASPVKLYARSRGIPVFQPEKLRSEENRPVLTSLQPDFIVVVAYGQILPGWLLEIPHVGSVNVHASLLPRYRGAAPISWAILNGDSVTGVTTMLMDEGLDTGPLLLQREVAIPLAMTAGELAEKLAVEGAELLIRTLQDLATGAIQPVPQDHAKASAALRIDKKQARISWEKEAAEIHNLVRAFNPWPTAYTDFRGRRLQIHRSFPEDNPGAAGQRPGTFLGCSRGGLRVRCGFGTVLEILEVQLAGRSRVTGREFANGSRLEPNTPLFPALGSA